MFKSHLIWITNDDSFCGYFGPFFFSPAGDETHTHIRKTIWSKPIKRTSFSEGVASCWQSQKTHGHIILISSGRACVCRRLLMPHLTRPICYRDPRRPCVQTLEATTMWAIRSVWDGRDKWRGEDDTVNQRRKQEEEKKAEKRLGCCWII
jgi:hypothetical protein